MTDMSDSIEETKTESVEDGAVTTGCCALRDDQRCRMRGTSLEVNMWYPRVDGHGTISEVRVGLVDVRSADDIVVRYDFDRDGYAVLQERCIEVEEGVEGTGEMVERAFVPAWLTDEPGESGSVAPPEPAFKQFVEEQRQAPSPQEHAEIDQRAAPSAIIAEDAAEFAKEQHDKRMRGHAFVEGPDLLASVLKYLDYQRAQLTIRQPEGDSGDISWLINKALANAGVSPEKALISAVQKLAEFQVDLYAQNAKIRKRLTELEAQTQAAEENRDELFHCVVQLDCQCRNSDPGWSGLDYPPGLDARMTASREQAEKERGNGKGDAQW